MLNCISFSVAVVRAVERKRVRICWRSSRGKVWSCSLKVAGSWVGVVVVVVFLSWVVLTVGELFMMCGLVVCRVFR